MIRIFVNRAFSRAARKERITDEILVTTAKGAEQGIYRADIGEETFKVDIARAGRGKSHGYRAILGLRPKHRAVFAFVWSKNDFENLKDEYLVGLKVLVRGVMIMDEDSLNAALEQQVLREIVLVPSDEGEQEQE